MRKRSFVHGLGYELTRYE